MAKITYNICVLIVTYSNRWQFLEQVLRRVITLENVTNVVVVDNASAYSVSSSCLELNDERISVITNAENLGSAGGYKAGLRYFVQKTEADFVWLLDDDNQPAQNALQKLLEAWEHIPGVTDRKALFSLRPDRKQHVRIAQGENANRFYLVENSFMGFNLFRVPFNQYYKLRDKFKKAEALKEKTPVPFAPYGGMFFHRKLVDLIGYPDERFFVYADDSEFTYRVTQQGGTIWLISGSKITDIDKSYGISYVRRFWRSIYLDLWSFRTYYQVRNSVYFYHQVTVKNGVIYRINKWLFLTGQWLISRLTSRQENYKKLVRAVDDGVAGRLGIINPEKYS